MSDRMRWRMAEVLRSLAGLVSLCRGTETAEGTDVEEGRLLLSQQVADVRGFIESSKFDHGTEDPAEIERLVSDAQGVYLVLLAVIPCQEKGRVLFPRAFRMR